MSDTPTDAEIDEVTLDVLGYAALDKETNETARMIARAVLAKWGTPQPVVREPLTCEWTHNDDDGYWDTSCGKAWRFDDGGPKENNMNFCHCCGKTLRIKGKEAVNADT